MPKKEKTFAEYALEGFLPTVERIERNKDDKADRKMDRRLVQLDEEEEKRKEAVRRSRGE